MINRLLQTLLALSLIFTGLGCSEKAASPDINSTSLNLEDQFGGYTASDEQPAFNDPSLMTAEISGEEYDDPLLSTPGVDSLTSDSQLEYYHLRIVWGHLTLDSSISVVTDWSGSLSVVRGVEILRRVIRFEPDQDYILPRTDASVIEWVSATSVYNDGIAVDVIVPQPTPTTDTSYVVEITPDGDTVETIVIDTTYLLLDSIEFETGPYSRTFALAEIADLDTIIYLDDSNAVAFHGQKVSRVPCPHGILTGNWGFDEDGKGVFDGVWMSSRGYVTGYLKGHFGQNENGINDFFGKWITRTGEFEGFWTGIWGSHPNYHASEVALQRAGGWFTGQIYSADEVEIGALRGKFKSAPMGRGGFFQGRWQIICPDPGDNESDHKDMEGI